MCLTLFHTRSYLMDTILNLNLQRLHVSSHFLLPDPGRATQCKINIPISKGTMLGKVRERKRSQRGLWIMFLCHTIDFSLSCSLIGMDKEVKALPTPLPPYYNVNARCVFNSGAHGHSTEDCQSLKYKVQYLIDSRVIVFTL